MNSLDKIIDTEDTTTLEDTCCSLLIFIGSNTKYSNILNTASDNLGIDKMSHLDPYEILNEHELAVIAGSFGSQAVLRTPAV